MWAAPKEQVRPKGRQGARSTQSHLLGDEQALPGDTATVVLSKTGLAIKMLLILPPMIHSEYSRLSSL